MRSIEEILSAYLEGAPLEVEEVEDSLAAFQSLVKSPAWASLVKNRELAAEQALNAMLQPSNSDFLTTAARREYWLGYRQASLQPPAIIDGWIEDLKRMREEMADGS